MASISNSLVLTKNLPLHSSPDKYLQVVAPTKLSFRKEISTSRRSLSVRSAYREGGGPSSESVFVGGFVLGGLIVGALGCVFAPQISKALAGADRKELMRKLPKFIYDEEKALEKTRKKLTEKIAQLNSAIDDVSAQFRTEDAPNGVSVNSDEMETAI